MTGNNKTYLYIFIMAKKGGAQNSNVKGKNGPSSAQSKNQVGEKQSAKD